MIVHTEILPRGEGLVVKNLHSKYIPAGRNDDWIKIKPDYMDGMGETVDGVVVGKHVLTYDIPFVIASISILGAWWGEGKRVGFWGSFMVAVKKGGVDPMTDIP
jgi:DNA ligase 4